MTRDDSGMLDMRQMPTLIHDDEAGIRQALAPQCGVCGGHDLVVIAPDNQGGQFDAMQPLLEVRIYGGEACQNSSGRAGSATVRRPGPGELDPVSTATSTGCTCCSRIDWIARNQARVRIWFEGKFGEAYEPLCCTLRHWSALRHPRGLAKARRKLEAPGPPRL